MEEENINFYKGLIEGLMFITFIFIGIGLSQINKIIIDIMFIIWGCILGIWVAVIYSKNQRYKA